LEDVVEKAGVTKGTRVKADKGYSSKKNRQFLKDQGIKDGIMHKAARNKPLSSHQVKLISW
jgi:IS5 family transposase